MGGDEVWLSDVNIGKTRSQPRLKLFVPEPGLLNAGSNFTVQAAEVIQKMKPHKTHLSTFGKDNSLPFLSRCSAPLRYKL